MAMTAPVRVEREAKLLAPASLDLSRLARPAKGTTAHALPERHLEAVYYDTADLRLARSGITVRHRTGEAGAPWTVKLADGRDGPALARREVRFAGPPGQVPAAAVDLVLATTRGSCLEPVARLSTRRRPIELRDRKGRVLAELVDDTVSVVGSAVRSFREVEIELAETGRNGHRVLERAVARLASLGCVVEAPLPKLVRALGEPAQRPADVTVSTLGTEATVADLLRATFARSVAQIIRHDPGVRLGDDPEDVHQLRVGLRRLRSDLRTFSRLLAKEQTASLRVELDRLGFLVGAVRDLDVLAGRLATSSAGLPAPDQAPTRLLEARIESQAHLARVAMLAALGDERYPRLLDVLVGLAEEPPTRNRAGLDDRPAWQLVGQLVGRPWRRLEEAVDGLGPRPADADLHRVRILAKRCRYAAEAFGLLAERTPGRLAGALADLQTVLGDHQDAVVAEAWLREAAADLPAAGVAAGELIAIERARRAGAAKRFPAAWERASEKQLRRWP